MTCSGAILINTVPWSLKFTIARYYQVAEKDDGLMLHYWTIHERLQRLRTYGQPKGSRPLTGIVRHSPCVVHGVGPMTGNRTSLAIHPPTCSTVIFLSSLQKERSDSPVTISGTPRTRVMRLHNNRGVPHQPATEAALKRLKYVIMRRISVVSICLDHKKRL